MNLINRIYKSISYRFLSIFGKHIPDKYYLKWMYRLRMNKKLNIDNPQTFNEKLQWLKINNRESIYTTMVDKVAAKEYVAHRIGKEYIIPTLGVWDSFEEIDFNTLPDQFVLKCTHDSGGLVICRDKHTFDKNIAREKISKSLKRDYYMYSREWPYKDVPRRILAEKYIEDETGELRDYKFFCFDGLVKAMFVATERQKEGEEVKFDFFDMNFVHLPLSQGHPNSSMKLKRPIAFDKMKNLASVLSKEIPYLRVDFYEVNGNVYFGELTFFHFSGWVPFNPREWDEKFGSWLNLPINVKNYY